MGLCWAFWEDWSSINLEYSTMEKSPSLELTASIGTGFSVLRCIQQEAQQGGCQAVVLGIRSKETGHFYRLLGELPGRVSCPFFPRLSRKLPVESDWPGYGSPFVPSYSSRVTVVRAFNLWESQLSSPTSQNNSQPSRLL